MIALDKYETQIDKHSLYNLLFGERFDQSGDTEPDESNVADKLDEPEAMAQSIIKQRFGYTPNDTDFLETATVAGVIYLLSRKPGNQIGPDEIDQRRQTFFDMLPGQPGSQGRAEIQTDVSRLGDWL